MKALLEQPNGLARRIVSKAGGNPTALLDAVDAFTRRQPRVSGDSQQVCQSAAPLLGFRAGRSSGSPRSTLWRTRPIGAGVMSCQSRAQAFRLTVSQRALLFAGYLQAPELPTTRQHAAGVGAQPGGAGGARPGGEGGHEGRVRERGAPAVGVRRRRALRAAPAGGRQPDALQARGRRQGGGRPSLRAREALPRHTTINVMSSIDSEG